MRRQFETALLAFVMFAGLGWVFVGSVKLGQLLIDINTTPIIAWLFRFSAVVLIVLLVYVLASIINDKRKEVL